MKFLFFNLLLVVSSLLYSQEKRDYSITGIAFYNLENLFDTEDDPNTFDDDRTPEGKDRWTAEIYRQKLHNMAFAISEIGKAYSNLPPAVIGICEIENKQVLEDLVNMPFLKPYNYQIVHYDSPDPRGIDVALLYRPEAFTVLHSAKYELKLYDVKAPQKRVFTRDQLVVSGYLEDDRVHFIVNHWPSRSGGEKLSSYKREAAARLTLHISDSLHRQDPYAKIVIMGDFNDDPTNKSISEILKAKKSKADLQLKELFNPYAALLQKGAGSLAYRDGWNLFDQIILSAGLIEKDPSKLQFFRAFIFNAPFLTTASGQYKGYPFRSFGNTGFTNGYSDHFPVYILLIKALD